MPASLTSVKRKPGTSRETPTTVTMRAGSGRFISGRASRP